jgi:hypothetical protein
MKTKLIGWAVVLGALGYLGYIAYQGFMLGTKPVTTAATNPNSNNLPSFSDLL